MSNIAIVTDSTANIPEELMRALPVHIVPLRVIWGSEVLKDGIDILPDEFYRRLQSTTVMPSTSQATPADFIHTYSQLLKEGKQILSLHISSKLSGTLDSAIQARAEFPGQPIELVDSISTSMGMGYQALLAARAAVEGATLQECKTLVEQARDFSGALFTVRTLEFLHRGGRIGGAAAFVGTALDLKPVLELCDGRVEAVERVRTMTKAVDRLIDQFEQKMDHRRPIRIGALYTNNIDEAGELLERVRQRFNVTDISEAVLTPVSPVIGTHLGPGALGLAYVAGI
ncbi:MAG: DegV family protein [Chloroflexi bacterium]|jgi:DegV family protein with EDD domain|nr:DegV family protein [Anaerolineaceae bacterium]NMB89864.1 DegV family protein [Chloroflexota bacterium]